MRGDNGSKCVTVRGQSCLLASVHYCITHSYTVIFSRKLSRDLTTARDKLRLRLLLLIVDVPHYHIDILGFIPSLYDCYECLNDLHQLAMLLNPLNDEISNMLDVIHGYLMIMLK